MRNNRAERSLGLPSSSGSDHHLPFRSPARDTAFSRFLIPCLFDLAALAHHGGLIGPTRPSPDMAEASLTKSGRRTGCGATRCLPLSRPRASPGWRRTTGSRTTWPGYPLRRNNRRRTGKPSPARCAVAEASRALLLTSPGPLMGHHWPSSASSWPPSPSPYG